MNSRPAFYMAISWALSLPALGSSSQPTVSANTAVSLAKSALGKFGVKAQSYSVQVARASQGPGYWEVRFEKTGGYGYEVRISDARQRVTMISNLKWPLYRKGKGRTGKVWIKSKDQGQKQTEKYVRGFSDYKTFQLGSVRFEKDRLVNGHFRPGVFEAKYVPSKKEAATFEKDSAIYVTLDPQDGALLGFVDFVRRARR